MNNINLIVEQIMTIMVIGVIGAVAGLILAMVLVEIYSFIRNLVSNK